MYMWNVVIRILCLVPWEKNDMGQAGSDGSREECRRKDFLDS